MKNKKIIYIIIIGLFLLEGIFVLNTIPLNKATSNPIIENYFISNEEYIYNVTQFDSYFTWVGLNWMDPPKGYALTNPGGQIKINFTRFGDKDPYDYSVFSEPVPYINVSLFENVSNSLIVNFTENDISNSEVAMNLALSYNAFLSGFLIPVNNLTELKSQAIEQVSPTGFMEGTVDIVETNISILFDFRHKEGSQNSTMLYDKWLGILLWAKIENSLGPDLEIFLVNKPYITPTWNTIPSDQTVEFGNTFSYEVSASDLSEIAYYEVNDTDNFNIDDNGLITDKNTLNVGIYWIEILAYNPYGYCCNATIILTVEDNTSPTWNTIPSDQTVEFGINFSYEVSASDLSEIAYYEVNDTDNFNIDNNGLITNSTILEIGSYILEIHAYDYYNNFCDIIITITVKDDDKSILPGYEIGIITSLIGIILIGIVIFIKKKHKVIFLNSEKSKN